MESLKSSEKNVPVRILHVDDDISMLAISEEILTMEGPFEIDSALNANEAFKKLKSNHYDAIISDYEMPLKDGLQFLSELREQKNDIPFILFTGKGREEVAIKALNLGSDAYINKQGKPETVYGELSDALVKTIERRNSRKLLKESESKYRKLVENSLQGIAIIQGPEPKFVFINTAMERIFGFSLEEILAMSPEEITQWVHPDDREILFSRFGKRLKGERCDSGYEFRGFHKDGTVRWVEVCSILIEYNGKPSVQGVFLDITERKNDEALSKKISDEWNRIFEATTDLVFTINKEHRIVKVNKRTCDFLKKKPEELIGKLCYEVVHGTSQPWINCPHKKVLETGESASSEIQNPHIGSTLLVSISPVPNEKGELVEFVHSAKAIDELKIIQDALEESKSYLETLLNSVLSGIVVIDAKTHRIVDANPAALSIIGVSKAEAVGKKCHKFVCPAEEGKCPVTDLGKTVDKSERVVLTADGTKIPVIKSVAMMKTKGSTFLVENFVDISDQKKTEETLQKSSKELETINEKLRVVGGLTRHDIRNKLCALGGNTYLLKKKYREEKQTIENLQRIEQACKEIEKICAFMKVYENVGIEDLTYINIEKVVNDSMFLFSDSQYKMINQSQGLTVLADSALEQLFSNLIDNTRKHGKKASMIKIYYEKPVGDSCNLIYEDDGVGISAENKPKLFNDCFSTEGGTGFGLFLIKKMIDAYGWNITEEGEPGKGTKFVISIPVSAISQEISIS
jgi:PAS domain S-box-containing protein